MFLFQIRDAELRKASFKDFDLYVCKKTAPARIREFRTPSTFFASSPVLSVVTLVWLENSPRKWGRERRFVV